MKKKKIKDITIKEIVEICRKNIECCLECPLYIHCGSPEYMTDEDLEKEVEVDGK